MKIKNQNNKMQNERENMAHSNLLITMSLITILKIPNDVNIYYL
jgi:hypothetical protein